MGCLLILQINAYFRKRVGKKFIVLIIEKYISCNGYNLLHFLPALLYLHLFIFLHISHQDATITEHNVFLYPIKFQAFFLSTSETSLK